MANKLTPIEIQEINRRIAAGKYEHVEDAEPQPAEEPQPKPARGARKQPEDKADA